MKVDNINNKNLIKYPSRTVLIIGKKESSKSIPVQYTVPTCIITQNGMKILTLHASTTLSMQAVTATVYPNASTNLNSLGMNARAVSALTRWSWYKALKCKDLCFMYFSIFFFLQSYRTLVIQYLSKRGIKLTCLWIPTEAYRIQEKNLFLKFPLFQAARTLVTMIESSDIRKAIRKGNLKPNQQEIHPQKT